MHLTLSDDCRGISHEALFSGENTAVGEMSLNQMQIMQCNIPADPDLDPRILLICCVYTSIRLENEYFLVNQ